MASSGSGGGGSQTAALTAAPVAQASLSSRNAAARAASAEVAGSSGGGGGSNAPKLSFGMAAKLKMKAHKAVGALRERRKRYQHMEEDPKNKKLSTFIRHTYCTPTFSTLPVVTLLAVYLTGFYESVGAKLAFISFFIALARSLDVLSDPCMSYITDSARTPWGRRKPFCAVGCWIYAIFLIALLWPPESLTGDSVSFWFGITYIGFFLANTLSTIPYDALGPELTDNYEDRSYLFFVSGLYDGIGALVAIMLPIFLAYAVSFTNGCPDGEIKCMKVSSAGLVRSCAKDVSDGEYTYYNLSEGGSALTDDFFDVESCSNDTMTDSDKGYDNYCSCIEECIASCDLENTRIAYRIVGLFFGTWFVVTMMHMVYNIKERSQLEGALQLEPTPPMVPSLLNTFRNRAFTALLPAWMADAIGLAMIASMLVYFVRYVIQPEYQTKEDNGIDCNEGVPVEGEDSDTWRCKSTLVLGALVTTILVAGFLSCPLWLFAAKVLGKRRAWLLWSCVMALTNFAFLMVGKGDIDLAIALAVLNGLPFGAKFLADAILSDIIDYDEFLSGQRNEATYTMFKSFLPKICAIPAAAIPIAILNALGHKAPEDGRVLEQPTRVRNFCVIITVVVPTVLSCLSFMIKSYFPLKTKAQVDMISSGIGKHMLGKSARDPISGIDYGLLNFTDEERELADIVDTFPSLADMFVLINNLHLGRIEVGIEHIILRMRKYMVTWLGLWITFLLSVIFGFGLLNDTVLSVIPVVLIIGMGVSMTASGFCIMRYRTALRLREERVKNGLTEDFLKRIISTRRKIERILDAQILQTKGNRTCWSSLRNLFQSREQEEREQAEQQRMIHEEIGVSVDEENGDGADDDVDDDGNAAGGQDATPSETKTRDGEDEVVSPKQVHAPVQQAEVEMAEQSNTVAKKKPTVIERSL